MSARGGTPPSATPPPPPPGARRQTLGESLWNCTRCALHGVADAFAWPSSLVAVYGSKTIQVRLLKCVIMNGCIFLGSILLFEKLVVPGLQLFLGKAALWAQEMHGRPVDGRKEVVSVLPGLRNILSITVGIAYNVLWVYPIYCVSFILNSIWYQEIADRAFELQVGKPAARSVSYERFLKVIADEIYRSLLLANFLFQASLVYLVPYAGPAISFMCLCWLGSFYSFEYKWINRGWSLEQRIEYFEERWAYFVGFGIPSTVATFFFPQFVSSGLFALLFPMFIIMANSAEPLPHRQSGRDFAYPIPTKLPIFALAKRANLFCIRRIPVARKPPSATSVRKGKRDA